MSGKKIKGPRIIKNTIKKTKGVLSDPYKKYQEWVKQGRPGGVFKK